MKTLKNVKVAFKTVSPGADKTKSDRDSILVLAIKAILEVVTVSEELKVEQVEAISTYLIGISTMK